MSKVLEEFEKAFLDTQKNHPCLNRESGRLVVATLEQKLNENKRKGLAGTFMSDLNQTLNLFKLYEGERRAYSALAGCFFGRRGAAVRHDK